MEKFNVRDAKLVSIIILIVLVFALAVGNAYKYLPEKSSEIPDVNTELNLPGDEEATEEQADEESESEEEEADAKSDEIEEVSKTAKTEEITNEKITPLENISDNDEAQTVETEQESYDDIINKGKQLKSEKQFVDAINEYKKALSLADTAAKKAECNEEIANIYALVKRYGTALSFAQRAYNLSPSTQREILLARLYYKTGEVDKASDRVNNILKRDFAQDN